VRKPPERRLSANVVGLPRELHDIVAHAVTLMVAPIIGRQGRDAI